MGHDSDFDDVIGGKSQSGDDEAIARLAEAQYGVVARAQLLAAGVGARAIDHPLQRKRLHPSPAPSTRSDNDT